jgi:1,5-anhydro-D-fructose reductase (1,5-anhydro-D-mannitol-forming)
MLNWLVIGIGDITIKRVLPAILAEPRSRLCGFVTRHPVKAQTYGAPAWTDLHRALGESGCDAVYVGTPVVLHAAQAIASLRAGKHVLCEKPTAMNYTEACAMQQVAVETGRLLGVAYYRRMYPKIDRAKQLIEQGAIGQVVFAEATAHSWYPEDEAKDGWRADPAISGGGPFYDIASHRIDLMNYLFGQPRRATGQLSNAVFHYGTEDNGTVMIEYAGGARGVVDARWHSKIVRDEFRIRGTEGELDLSPLNDPPLVTPSRTEQIPAPANLHYPCVEEFVTSALDRTAPFRSSIDSAVWVDWVTQQVVERQEGG